MRQAWVLFILFSCLHAQAETEPLAAVRELKTLSIQSSPSLKEARARFELSGSSQYTAWTQWFPNLDFQLSDSWSKDYSALSGGSLGVLSRGIEPQDVNTKKWSLNAKMPLYRRSVHLGVSQAKIQKQIDQSKWIGSLQDWDTRFFKLLGECLLKRFEIRVLERSIEAAIRSLNENKIRFQQGQITRIDVLRAEAHLSSLQNSQTQVRATESDQKRRLIEFTGIEIHDFERLGLLIDERDEESVMSLIRELYKTESIEVDSLVNSQKLLSEFSMEKSEPFQQFLLQENFQFEQASLAMTREWPDLSLQGSYGRQALEWGQLFNPDERSRSFSVVLSIPLFSGGSLWSTANERTAHRQIAIQSTLQSKQKFLTDIEQDLDRARVLKEQLKSNETEEQRFEEILKLTRRSFDLGKSTQKDVLESEHDWFESRLKRASSRVELGVLFKKLSYELGVTE